MHTSNLVEDELLSDRKYSPKSLALFCRQTATNIRTTADIYQYAGSDVTHSYVEICL